MMNNKNLKFSSSSSKPVLKPFFITGFTDAEGCFHIGINKHSRFKQGYSVEAVFKIHLHQKDLALLEMIQTYAPFFFPSRVGTLEWTKKRGRGVFINLEMVQSNIKFHRLKN